MCRFGCKERTYRTFNEDSTNQTKGIVPAETAACSFTLLLNWMTESENDTLHTACVCARWRRKEMVPIKDSM